MKKTLLLLGAVALMFAGSLGEAKAQTIIVDDSDPGFTASTNWFLGGGGTYHWRITGPYADPATWAAKFINPGAYKISAIWAAGSNRTVSAPYIIYHAGGTTTVMKNQQVNGGAWNTLGTFYLNAGANQVKLSPWTTPGYVIIADAIKWQQ